MTSEDSVMPPNKEKLFQILSIPGWLAFLFSLLHFTEDVLFLREYFPSFIALVQRLTPEKLNVPVLVVSVMWILAFLILGPKLAERVGPGKTVAIMFASLLLVSVALGIHSGMQQ